MLKKISFGLAGIIAAVVIVVLILAAMKPDEFRVERSAKINASTDKIFPLINDLHAFGAWSPYEKMDPSMERRYEGPSAGVGAIYGWSGDGNAGEGQMEIVEAVPNEKVVMKLDFTKPFEAHNMVEFTLKPEGDATKVTWAMYGPVTFLPKIMHVIFDMDQMVGSQFDEGLQNLRSATEQ